MTTLLDLQTRIATDLTRSDLTSQIANAVSDAVNFFARERFWFNTSRNLTFNTVAGQIAYGANDYSVIPNLVKIDAMFVPQAQSVLPLDRYEPADFEMLNNGSTGGGIPKAFTYVDQTIRLWPTPNAAFTITIHAHYKLAALVNPTDSSSWTTDAEELIRSHAKLLLFTDVLSDGDGASAMAAKIPVLLGALRSESSARMSSGVVQGTEF
jgi:hypothetical protein